MGVDRGRTLPLVSDAHVAEIRKLQPFVDPADNSPNVMLGMLEAMANRDKHRLGLATYAQAFKGNVKLTPRPRRAFIRSRKEPIPLEGRAGSLSPEDAGPLAAMWR